MQALIPSPQLKVVSLEDAMIQLADEGVPVRAIARSTHTPSDEVYEVLKDALVEGKLIELPQNDWPPGSLRRSRRQADQSILNFTDEQLSIACHEFFKMTRLQAAVFVAILRRPEITKDQVHTAIEATRAANSDPTDQKMIDVVICHIRKCLTDHAGKGGYQKVQLKTIWGQGYALPRLEREKVLALLTTYFAETTLEQAVA
jgi:DNA-binding response OmpR family regulator